jgi:hypothetical protein
MKKVVLVLVLLALLSTGAVVSAADVDGVWYCSSPDCSKYAMTRANGGSLLFTVLGYDLASWVPMYGPFDGTNGYLTLLLTSQAHGGMPQSATAVFTVTSPTSATLTVTSCTDFPQQHNCPPVGVVYTMVFQKVS